VVDMKYNIVITKEQLLDPLYDDSGCDVAAGVVAFDPGTDEVEPTLAAEQVSSAAALPKSLHKALKHEAARQGEQLDQLVVTTLAGQLSDLASTRNAPAVPVIRAFLEVRDGYSADRVVADPELNKKFLDRVRELGATGTDFEVNWMLFNARKNGLLSLPTKTRRFSIAGKDNFEFATEMAICHIQAQLEREMGERISLDKIICDPDLAERFDSVAALLAPDHSPIEYRWVVLGLRKARRLSKKAANIDCPRFKRLGSATEIRMSRLPIGQGLYVIRTDRLGLYVGETDNLRHRIEHHFESAGGKALLPEWLFDVRRDDVQLGVLSLDANTRHEYRKTLELGCIGKYRPPLNYVSGQAR
jgi:site-specific DNA-methyltransferase (adenine-specific)